MKASIIAGSMCVLAVLAWVGFWFVFTTLTHDRVGYADALATAETESARGESLVRLRSAVQGTVSERTALEGLVSLKVLDAVEQIETAAMQAGGRSVAIGEAALVASTPGKLSTFTVGVNADGSFASLIRAVRLFETLPIPATLEQFDITKSEKDWHLNARLRVTLSTTQ